MPRGISQEDVWKACDALLLEGARPTIERVRQKVGSGSPNTVGPFLDTWFKHLGGRLKDPGSFSPPPEVPDPVMQAASHFWEVAQAEARRDVEIQVREGLAAATANVEAGMARAAEAEAAALAANLKVSHLQTQLSELQATLEAERVRHAATTARAEAADRQCTELHAAVTEARQTAGAERARADNAITMADERAHGAERRAALEIDRERGLRAKAEKAVESIAKRFEASLKAEISANEQLNAVQAKLGAQRAESAQREQELQTRLAQQEVKLQELEVALAQAQQAVAQATAQEALVKKIVSELGPARRQPRNRAAAVASDKGKP
ncbi:DNA-binding protein [Roseateles sp. BYS180W]|uniref:DNA-binding protein n=1 Tax=Roseateles rivi TaxID=3299028 RepID=A0ABW7FZR3_9BURK